MPLFETRIIERLVRVYQVEAANEEEADRILQESDSSDYEAGNWPLDSEEGEPWHEVNGDDSGSEWANLDRLTEPKHEEDME